MFALFNFSHEVVKVFCTPFYCRPKPKAGWYALGLKSGLLNFDPISESVKLQADQPTRTTETANKNREGAGTRETKNTKTTKIEQGENETELLQRTEADLMLIFCNFNLIDQDYNGQGMPKTMPKKKKRVETEQKLI